MAFEHKPVLLQEVLNLLAPQPGDIVVDCTFGAGGHSKAMWQQMQRQGQIIGIDQDQEAIRNAGVLPRGVTLVHDNFLNIRSILLALGISQVDRVLFDLGVSSPQLDIPARGFSYRHDASLDMRMNQQSSTSAADLVNNLDEAELARIIWEYGEERWAQRIASFIVKQRAKNPIATTGQLVEIIKKAIPAGARRGGPHPAKRTFQALRIAVNQELAVITPSLTEAVEVMNIGGRIAVITFHSLEDRLVKQTFKQLERGCICPPRLPVCVCGKKPMLKIITKKPILPSNDELDHNPRSRSAKLRVAERV